MTSNPSNSSAVDSGTDTTNVDDGDELMRPQFHLDVLDELVYEAAGDAVLRDVSFDLVAEELGHMRDSYESIATRVETDDVVGFARPLAWCHAEFLTALVRKDA